MEYPAPDFSLAANPTSLTVNGGTNGTSTITVTPTEWLERLLYIERKQSSERSHRHVCHESNHRR